MRETGMGKVGQSLQVASVYLYLPVILVIFMTNLSFSSLNYVRV